jgi:hypothetical protein
MFKESSFGVDGRFLQQIYYLSLGLMIILSVVFEIVFGFLTTISFVVGSFFSLGSVFTLGFFVRRMVKPGSSTKTKRWLGLIALGKYALIAVGFYALVKAEWLNVYSLAVGVALVQLAVILEAIKLMVLVLLHNSPSRNG